MPLPEQQLPHLHYDGPDGKIFTATEARYAAKGDDLLRGLQTVLFLSWDPATPGPWFARLALFPLVRGAALVTWEREGQPVQLLARLAPATPALWRRFLRDFFASPAAYHAAPFDPEDLPQTLTNYRPDILPEEVVRAAVESWGAAPDAFTYVEET